VKVCHPPFLHSSLVGLTINVAVRLVSLRDADRKASQTCTYVTFTTGNGCCSEYARRNHPQAQQRDQRCSGRSQVKSAVFRLRRYCAFRHARRLRQAHRRRNREMEQGRQVRGHQGGLIVTPTNIPYVPFRGFRASATRCCAASYFQAACRRWVQAV
jgi:hypothetical protein